MQDKASFIGASAAKAYANRLRRRNLPPMQNGEVERLVADFLATRDITGVPRALCGTGRAAATVRARDDAPLCHRDSNGGWPVGRMGGSGAVRGLSRTKALGAMKNGQL